jgi:hypothetical protein
MINRKELAICKRRGHAGFVREGWTQCNWCGTWWREVRRIEEREDDPPEEEVDVRVQVSRRLERVQDGLDSIKRPPEGGSAPSSKGPRRQPKKR